MMTFSQMILRFGVALVLGALMGLEREMVGKEAGIRTSLVVSGGAAIFTIIGLVLPELTGTAPNGAGFTVIASIVTGIGFLGAGIIIKTEGHVRSLTTAAVIWTTASIGVLAGMGLFEFAATAAVGLTILLYLLRKLDVADRVHPSKD